MPLTTSKVFGPGRNHCTHEDVFRSAIASQDGLSAMEVEMKKLEGIVKEIVDELGYLKDRETIFQITNGMCHCSYVQTEVLKVGNLKFDVLAASTNERVQKFGLLTLVTLIALGVWQIFHLRAFFRRKYLID
jgi:p24 family protein delta-1